MKGDKIKELARFEENLKTYGIGGLLRRANRKQQEVLAGVLETGKKGQLTIKIVYQPSGMNEVAVTAEVSAKVPERSLDSVKMYADHRGLFEDNPDQMNFDNIRQIDDKPKKVKEM